MSDNIRPKHYRTGEIDLFEAWYRTYPFEQYRAIMQAIAERYMRRDKNNRVEDIGKAIYTLERLKEKEIEHSGKGERVSTKDGNIILKSDKDSESVFLLKGLLEHNFNYLVRNSYGDLWAHTFWCDKPVEGGVSEMINNDMFPEVKWTDDEPTRIVDLLATYENGGENGKVDGE